MTEPVTLADLKAHLRLKAGASGEDTYLNGLIVSARRAVELTVRRRFSGDTPTLTGDDAELAAQAILLVAAYWYENRDATGRMPPAVTWITDALQKWDAGE